jgi:hypothetical protein
MLLPIALMLATASCGIGNGQGYLNFGRSLESSAGRIRSCRQTQSRVRRPPADVGAVRCHVKQTELGEKGAHFFGAVRCNGD